MPNFLRLNRPAATIGLDSEVVRSFWPYKPSIMINEGESVFAQGDSVTVDELYRIDTLYLTIAVGKSIFGSLLLT
jgi:hypothetical protein